MAVREKETVPEPRRKWRRISRRDVVEWEGREVGLLEDDGEEGGENGGCEVCSQRAGCNR